MINIAKAVAENRKEAFDIIKANGGRIEFASNIIHGSTDDDDDWDGDNDELDELPAVVVSGSDCIVDAVVLAVKCGDEDNKVVDFLAFDIEADYVIGWLNYGDAVCSCDDNIYQHIYEHYSK